MTVKDQMTFWGFAIAAFAGLLFLFQSVLLPFVLGGAIAYLLNPAVNGLQRLKLSRNWAVIVILFVFSLLMLALLTLLLPPLYREAAELAQKLPDYAKYLIEWGTPYIESFQSSIGLSADTDWQALLGTYAGSAAEMVKKIAQNALLSGLAVMDFLTLLVITPIMAYFMMQEWPHITGFIDDMLPRQHRKTIVNLLSEIDKKLSSFVRGQISVVFILAALYAVALSVVGLKYGFLIGLCAGLLSIIPMLGSVVGLFVAVVVAWFQAGALAYVAMIAGIFIAGQIIEGYVLTPKLVGDSVGLHPLWVFFAIMAGGSLLGIVGMLLAIPIAAIVSVLLAFGLHHYKKSAYYKPKAAPKTKKAVKKTAKKNTK